MWVNGYESQNTREAHLERKFEPISPLTPANPDPTHENTKALHLNTRWVIIGTIVAILSLLSGLGIFQYFQPKTNPTPEPPTQPQNQASPKPR